MLSLDRVASIIRDIAASEIMPLFGSLAPDQIAHKDTPGDPEDVVTQVDHRVEERLIAELSGIIANATFLGEESAAATPGLLGVLSQDAPVWVIDPIDGTKNFAGGRQQFGVMVALVQAGRTRASWICVPASSDMLVAEDRSGTWLNGTRVQLKAALPAHRRGTIHSRLMPLDVKETIAQNTSGRYEALPSSGAAATEYLDVIRGIKDFVVYYRLLPWDHAAGALALEEAGGSARHLDGEPYSPLSADQVTIFAASPLLGQQIQSFIRPS